MLKSKIISFSKKKQILRVYDFSFLLSRKERIVMISIHLIKSKAPRNDMNPVSWTK